MTRKWIVGVLVAWNHFRPCFDNHNLIWKVESSAIPRLVVLVALRILIRAPPFGRINFEAQYHAHRQKVAASSHIRRQRIETECRAYVCFDIWGDESRACFQPYHLSLQSDHSPR